MTSFVKCPACGSVLSVAARACPSCGAGKAKATGILQVAGAVLVGYFALLLGYMAYEGSKTPTPTPEKPGQRDLQAASFECRVEAEGRLKDPSSAQWDGVARFTRKGDVIWVSRPLRAKNSFGAYDLSTIVCAVRKSGQAWTVSSVEEVR